MTVYDKTTENGIEYINRIYVGNAEYKRVVDTLDMMAVSVNALYAGEGETAAYSIGNRSRTITQIPPDTLLKRWDRLWVRKRQLESVRTARKAVGIVHRDW